MKVAKQKGRKDSQKTDQNQRVCAKSFVWRYLFALALGAILTALCFIVFQNRHLEPIENLSSLSMNSGLLQSPQDSDLKAGKCSVMELLALPDKELDKIDVLEMSIAVAREVKGFEHLDYNYYNQLIDSWTQQFLMWLPTVEQEYYQDPPRWKNDINFARLGALAQWLDQAAGMHYIPEHITRQKEGLGVEYKDLRQMLVFGLIDTKEGTCATMPVLQIIMGRKCGWPVSLICVKHHYMLRYDDGKNRYNLEATDTGRGGFAIATDAEVMEEMKLSPQAVACGSDLRSLTNREIMAVFIAARARYYKDTNQMDLSDRDYSLARSQFPKWRSLNYMSISGYVWRNEQIFEPGEYGHPSEMSELIYYLSPTTRKITQDQQNQQRKRLATQRQMEIDRRRIEGTISPVLTQNPPIMQNNQPYNPNPQVPSHPTPSIGPVYPNPA
jgi:hypothetical protein